MVEKEKDIVSRLREDAVNCGASYANAKLVHGLLLIRCQEDCADAADEIERLRRVEAAWEKAFLGQERGGPFLTEKQILELEGNIEPE